MAELLRRMAPLSRAEPGCLQYDVHATPTIPNRFFLFERYADRRRSTRTRASPHFQELVLGEALPLLDERRAHGT